MTEAIDEQRAAQFAARVLDLLTGSVLTKMIALGARTGLLEAMAAGPATSEELARRAGLHERYVREWLATMTTGGLVDYDAEQRVYSLPPEHARYLTGDSARNQAPAAAMLEAVGRRTDVLEHCFRNGGGVPYSAFRPEFTDVMDDSWRRVYDQQLLRGFLPVAPEVVERLRAGCRAVDIGCGTGHAVNLMAAAFPASELVGYDSSPEAIDRATDEAARTGLGNAHFEVLDVLRIPLDTPIDVAFAFDAIHDQADPAGVLRRVHDALAPDGVFFMVDFKFHSDVADNVGDPLAPIYYGISTMHCMTVSLALGGAGLGTVWGVEQAGDMLAAAGFASVTVHDSPRPQNCIYECRKV